MFFVPVVLPVAGVAAITKFHLMGKSHAKYDRDIPPTFRVDPNSEGIKAQEAYLFENFIKPSQEATSTSNKLSAKRERFNKIGLNRKFDATFTPATIEANGWEMPGEWTTVTGTDPNRRILYIHGGAFTVGSPVSHRPLIVNLAKKTGCAVFAPDYRLMPENSRRDGIEDARAAYHWILGNGPNGAAPVEKLAVAGDSAGGNLTLMISNYARDEGLRAPDAVVGISPLTDATAESPTFKSNFDTDTMLQPLLKPLLKTPRFAFLWAAWLSSKISPAHKDVSPLRADLSNLPPTLIHASSSEMLYGDAVRYVTKATSQGTRATLQSWDHVCHVWHIFDEMLPEALQAIDEIAKFLRNHGVATPLKITA